MGDSDDEFDRRRRDKFRRERNDYERREDRSRDRGGQWEERGRMGWDKRERRDNYRELDRRRERYSPNGRQDISPPMKRFRGDWEERGGGSGGGYSHYEGGYSGGGGAGSGHHHGSWGGAGAGGGGEMGPPQGAGLQRGQEPDFPTQPPMMSFKQFLSSQDDNITDEESIKKYNEYKVDFKKQQINEFFLGHKEEEWFKAKYSPEEFDKRQETARQALKNRCSVFKKLLSLGRIQAVSIDVDKSDNLIKLLDAAVLLMEGGTETDLQILDQEQKSEEESREPSTGARLGGETEGQQPPAASAMPVVARVATATEDKEDGEEDDEEEGEAPKDAMETENPMGTEAPVNDEGTAKSKRRDYYESASDSDSSSGSDSEPENDNVNVLQVDGAGDDPPGSEAGDGEDVEDDEADGESSNLSAKEAAAKKSDEKDADTTTAPPAESTEDREPNDNSPRALHRTHSIFLRNLAPTITKQEVEAMCKRFPGFLRVALQDPQPERRFFRRGWVTFDRTVNIKEICWNLNNIRLRDCEMGAIVNRELKQRIRPVNGITAHKTVTKQDIKHAAKIIQNFDNRWDLWKDEEEKKDEEKDAPMSMGFGLVSNNPVLKNITDYLVDEGSYEEEAYFGECIDDKPKENNPEVSVERDIELCQVLDRMIMYLRIVHSFDYYSGVEYPNEDEMPHRCGIIHARGAPPPNRISQHDINEWNNTAESRIAPFLNYKWMLDNEEAVKLGLKDSDAEVEKFIQANTQELAKDKWLCPLSGKKFKGPEFVRKHLFNKHGEKVDEVRQEVSYFNNYLLDPKRPHLPEHPSSRQGVVLPQYRTEMGGASGMYGPAQGGGAGYQGATGYRGGGMGGGGYHRPPMYNNYQGHKRGQKRGYHQSGNYGGRGGGGGHDPYRVDYRRERGGGGGGFYRRDRVRQDPRGIIEYRDLDAPDDSDIF